MEQGVSAQFEIKPIDASLVDASFDLASAVFAASSSLHSALDVTLQDYRAYLRAPFVAMIAEGLSVAALDRASGAMAGCLIATDLHAALSPAPVPDGPLGAIAALSQQAAQRYAELRPFQSGEVMLVDMAAVAKPFGGQGIYLALRNAAQCRARKLGFRRVVGELSSPASQHVVLNRLGHEKVLELPLRTFRFRDGFPFAAINEPQCLILSEGRLSR